MKPFAIVVHLDIFEDVLFGCLASYKSFARHEPLPLLSGGSSFPWRHYHSNRLSYSYCKSIDACSTAFDTLLNNTGSPDPNAQARPWADDAAKVRWSGHHRPVWRSYVLKSTSQSPAAHTNPGQPPNNQPSFVQM